MEDIRTNKVSNSTQHRVWWQTVARFVLLIAILYVVLVLVVCANETRLVYPGSKFPQGNWRPAHLEIEEVEFASADGTNIVGWLMFKQNADRWVLVCHGNAENVAQSAQRLGIPIQSALNANVMIFDYRGFGKSQGTPSEAGVLQDAEAALKWLNDRTDTTPDQIIVFGNSLGGGPAVHLAAKFGARALILEQTFASLVEPAKELYWFLPVSLMMRNRFPSAEKIAGCSVPLFQAHGNRDDVVPIESGRKLFDASPAAIRKFVVLNGIGHWDPYPASYWATLADFVDRLPDLEGDKVEPE
jgi:fermentation-respiration switch protein FrsA (DUF1100 family)